MIQAGHGEETENFITYIRHAVSKLAAKEYTAFVGMFDNSRLSEEDIILALRFLDNSRPVTKVDDPLKTAYAGQSEHSRNYIYTGEYRDHSGYYMDFDLSTDGKPNDLTLSCEFLKTEGGYYISLLDLHTM